MLPNARSASGSTRIQSFADMFRARMFAIACVGLPRRVARRQVDIARQQFLCRVPRGPCIRERHNRMDLMFCRRW
jgi:hypothetical protein